MSTLEAGNKRAANDYINRLLNFVKVEHFGKIRTFPVIIRGPKSKIICFHSNEHTYTI
jgi:hypothetical protein